MTILLILFALYLIGGWIFYIRKYGKQKLKDLLEDDIFKIDL